ncbi:putative electron transfer flavoprotein subunit [Podochytrium sp. JEL0797]|nr:putative electron transfer flavoprotein subunit [Podochytrium sp. JEL0797]
MTHHQLDPQFSYGSVPSIQLTASDGSEVHPDQHHIYEYLLDFASTLSLSPALSPTPSPLPSPATSPYIPLTTSTSSPSLTPTSPYFFAPGTNLVNSPPPQSPPQDTFLQLLHPPPTHHYYQPLQPAHKGPLQCTNCLTLRTSVWRRDEAKQLICNACGLFRKKHGKDRPSEFPFRKSGVKRRNRLGM